MREKRTYNMLNLNCSFFATESWRIEYKSDERMLANIECFHQASNKKTGASTTFNS